MHADRTRKAKPPSGGEMQISFSAPVMAAIGDLAAAVHFSEHFDSDIRKVLQDWAGKKTLNANSFLVAFPAVAEETFKHIQATGDTRASDAWDGLRIQMAENGFTLSANAVRAR